MTLWKEMRRSLHHHHHIISHFRRLTPVPVPQALPSSKAAANCCMHNMFLLQRSRWTFVSFSQAAHLYAMDDCTAREITTTINIGLSIELYPSRIIIALWSLFGWNESSCCEEFWLDGLADNSVLHCTYTGRWGFLSLRTIPYKTITCRQPTRATQMVSY